MEAATRRKKLRSKGAAAKGRPVTTAEAEPRSDVRGAAVRGRGRGGRHGWGRGGQARGYGSGSASERPRRPLSELLDYLRACTKTLGGGMPNKEDEVMLATRAVEEMGDRALLVAADQRGSKLLEKLLRRTGAEAFATVFQQLAEAVPDLAPNQYASHVLQSALSSWAERLGETPPPPTAPLISLCATLREDAGWSALVHDPCASHVVRALILSLGGYAPGLQGRDRAATRAGLLPEKRLDVPAEIRECRHNVANALLELLREDAELCLNAHASPVVQLLLRVLRDRGDRFLVGDVTAAVIGSGPTGAPSLQTCDALIQSAPGSRALEAVLETSGADTFGALFIGYFRPRLRGLVSGEQGDFGAFLVQRVADGLRDEPQLLLALADVDFAACLKTSAAPALQAVAVKFVEACLRIRAGLKQCAAEVFRALDLRSPEQHRRAWPTLLALESTDSPAALLRPDGRSKGAAKEEGHIAADKFASDTIKDAQSLRALPATGAQLLSSLLRFPAEAVQPLNAGLPELLKHHTVLHALARESRTARVLETALARSSALIPKLRIRLARAFIGALGCLGPHPVGGWVCAALWRASLGQAQLRQTFAQELLAVEDALRAHNFAVWKVCGLHQVKTRQEEWLQQQQKAGKAKRFFDEILEGGDVEAAKAAARVKAQAAEDAADREAARQKAAVSDDPVLAGLLPAQVDQVDTAERGVDAAEAVAAKPDVAAAGADEDDELDELFSRSGRARGKRKKSKQDDEEKSSGLQMPLSSEIQAEAPSTDETLREALELIAGRAPARMRKKKRQIAATAAQAADEEDSDNASAHAIEARGKASPAVKSPRPKKGKRAKLAS